MRDLTGGAHGSERLLQAFATMPPGALVAVYRADDDGAALMAYAASYLAWPRAVELIATNETPAGETEARESGASIGTLYCRLLPPTDASIVARFGTGMTLVRNRESTGTAR